MSVLLFLSAALAQDVPEQTAYVLYSGFEPGLAIEQTAALAERSSTNLKAVTLRELRESTGPSLTGSQGEGITQVCDGIASTMSNVRGAIVRAENAVAYMEFENANVHLGIAFTALSCLQEPLESESAGRIFYLSGVVNYAGAKLEEAEVDFGRARTFHPAMVWDSYFPAASKPLFDAVFQAPLQEGTASLSVLPKPGPLALWIDGARVEGEDASVKLSPGLHAVQVVTSRAHTAFVHLEEGDAATLILPSSVPDTAINWVTDTGTQAQFSSLIQALFPPESQVYVVAGGQVWKGGVGHSTWEALAIPTRLKNPGTAVDRQALASKSLLWGGGGIALLSGGYAGLSWFRAQDAYRTGLNAAEYPVYSEAEGRFYEAGAQYTISGAVALSSLLLMGTGWMIRDKTTGVQPVALWSDGHSGGFSWTVGY
jgi:hypothetical protein